MYYDLLKIDKEMDMTKYSLKDLALYFEKFYGYICEIKTDNRIENLCMMLHSAHTTFHNTGRKVSMETRKKISESKRMKK